MGRDSAGPSPPPISPEELPGSPREAGLRSGHPHPHSHGRPGEPRSSGVPPVPGPRNSHPPLGESLGAARAPGVPPDFPYLSRSGATGSRKPALWAHRPGVPGRASPPHHPPLAHRAPGGAPAGLGSFAGCGDAGGGWVAVLGGHPGSAGSDANSEDTTVTAGLRAHPPAFELNAPAALANQRLAWV